MILFPSGATTFETQGLGSIIDAISCNVHEVLNGEYELEMQYPITGLQYNNLQNRRIIYSKHDPYSDPQPFRIYRITRPMNGIISIYARHVSYDLAGIPVGVFDANNAQSAIQGLKNNSLVANPFLFETTMPTVANFSCQYPQPCRNLLGGQEGSILDVYGGEYEWDEWTVHLQSRRGLDNGVRITYGKNLIDIEQDENISNLKTGIVPYWINSENGEVIYSSPQIIQAPGEFNFSSVVPVDFGDKFESQPTPEQLADAGQQYVTNNKIGVPTVSIDLSFAQLEQYSLYESTEALERVRIGDTVYVFFAQLGINVSSRIVETNYDPILNRYNSVSVGSVRANIAGTIADQQQQIDDLTQNPTMSSAFKKAVSSLTQTILGAKGGSVRFLDTDGDGEPDTLYIADDPDPSKAQKVWRFNYEGWGASENGYDGPFEIGATLNDGIVANFITVGVLNGDLIQTGTIKSPNGRMTINLDQGKFSTWGISSLTGEEIIFNFNNGTITQMQGNLKSGEWYNDNKVGILATGQIDAYGINILREFNIDNKQESNRITVAYHDEAFRNRITLAGEAYRIWTDTTGSGESRLFAYISGKELTIETDVLYVEGVAYKPKTITVDGQEYTVLGA
nr:MAG TPA: tail protein [Caudoviricetes sp.]